MEYDHFVLPLFVLRSFPDSASVSPALPSSDPISNQRKDSGDERFKSFYLFYILDLMEFALMTFLLHSNYHNLQEVGVFNGTSLVSVMYGSIACFLLSGVFFCLYHSPILHPDSLKQRVSYKQREGVWMFGELPQCGAVSQRDTVGDIKVSLKVHIKLDNNIEQDGKEQFGQDSSLGEINPEPEKVNLIEKNIGLDGNISQI